MASVTQLQTLSSDRLYQQQRLKEAVSLVTEQDTDLVIVSEEKQRIPCHSSLLALYSPVVATLLSGLPCCCTPTTIFLPDFQATHITKLLHLLRSGQAVTGTDVTGDITMIEKIARILQIPITTNDLAVGPYLDNPFHVKDRFNVKREINSDEEENVERLETISVRQEEGIEESGSEESPKTSSPKICGLEIEDEEVANGASNDHLTQGLTIWIEQDMLDDMLIKTEANQDNPESLVHLPNGDNTNTASINREKIDEENSSFVEMSTSSIHGIIPSISFSNEELDHSSCDFDPLNSSSSHIKRKASTHYNRPSKFHKINNNNTEIEIIGQYQFKSGEITEAVLKVLKKEADDDTFSTEVFPKFTCGECAKSFSNAATLLVHAEKHRQSKGHRKCPLCNFSGVRTNLLNHIRGVHTKEKLFECSVCQRRFPTCHQKNNHEMRHMSSSHPIERLLRKEKQPKEKLFECSVCVKKFFTSAMKDIHESAHKYEPKEKEFECSVCRKKFFTAEIKDTHEKAHIYQPKQKLFQCCVCHKKLSSAKAKKEHEKRHTK